MLTALMPLMVRIWKQKTGWSIDMAPFEYAWFHIASICFCAIKEPHSICRVLRWKTFLKIETANTGIKHSGKSATIRESNHGSGVYKEHKCGISWSNSLVFARTHDIKPYIMKTVWKSFIFVTFLCVYVFIFNDMSATPSATCNHGQIWQNLMSRPRQDKVSLSYKTPGVNLFIFLPIPRNPSKNTKLS